MVSANNITVNFGGFTLFDNVSFMVNENDRIGLVGKNGAGKSTLLKIFRGLQQPTSGNISTPKDFSMGYLPQQMTVADGKSVIEETMTAFDELNRMEITMNEISNQLVQRTDYESEEYMNLIERLHEITERHDFLGGNDKTGDTEKALVGLGFKRSDFARATSEFSGGWRMRIELAKILLTKPRLLLLDEPTNHLDIESIRWLEDYLRNYYGALILISHDRAFLDAVTNRTVEISLGKIYDYKTSYSKFVELRKERREQQSAAYENQRKMIEKTEEFIERFRYKASKANQVQSRIKQLDRLDIIEIDDEDLAKLNIKFPPAPRAGREVFKALNLTKTYGEHTVFADINLLVERGDRVAFVGRNGEGKTTLSKIIVGELGWEGGDAIVGYNVKIGYFAQNQDDLMLGDDTVFDVLDKVAVGDIRSKLRDILGAFLFRGEDIDKKVKVLSGGERSRLAMAKLMLEPYNLLVLDEPTNHMDMRSKDILKNALLAYDGTLIVVSHDREFLDGLVNKVYEFRDGAVREHLGGIYEFLERRQFNSLSELELKQQSQPKADKDPKSKNIEKKGGDRQSKKLEQQIGAVEQNIEQMESELSIMDLFLTQGNMPDTDFFEKYEKMKKSLSIEMEKWEQLCRQYENLQD
ncbi:MAG: ATP-binding cassette domain-containing protein [Prevotellaceae bacterium]|jgi:ATP-binding cassette subfamily F protein 3|nr:ATP-binding cassette domain-containing protein [Prevotellaceae bacterium]